MTQKRFAAGFHACADIEKTSKLFEYISGAYLIVLIADVFLCVYRAPIVNGEASGTDGCL